MDRDQFERIAEREGRRARDIVQRAVNTYNAPEVERAQLSEYVQMSDEDRQMLPKDQRQRLEKLRQQLERKYGL